MIRRLLIALCFTAACSRAPNASREFEKGVADYKAENFAKAAEHFERAMSLAPPTPQALNFLAVCQLHQGHTEAAVKNLREALRFDDNLVSARYNLALAYVQASAWKQAKETLATTAKNATDFNLLGIVHTQLREYPAASRQFSQAIATDPQFAPAYLNLAVVEQHHLGKKQDAMSHYQKFLDLDPKNDRTDKAHDAIIQIAQELNPRLVTPVVTPPSPTPPPAPTKTEPAPAPKSIEVVTAPLPPPPPQPAPTPAPVEPTQKVRPDISDKPLKSGNRARAAAHFNKGVQSQQGGNLKAAISFYEAAITADPSFAAAYYNLAIADRADGQPDKALENYELALRANPDYNDARFNYAILLQEQGYTADAVQQYERILQTNPNDAAAHLSLATLYAHDKSTYDLARDHYQFYVRLAPNSPLTKEIRRWLDQNH